MRVIASNKLLFPFLILSVFLGCNRMSESKEQDKVNRTEVSENDGSKLVTNLATEEKMRQAALDGDEAMVKNLIEAGTNVNALDVEGHTALMFAAFNGHSNIAQLLLEGGAVVDRRDLMGRTALLYASTGPFPETVKLLLDKGAEPNIVDSDEHFTPLMHAAAEGNLDVVKVLLEYGADLSLTDVDGDDAESFARQAGHFQVADYLQSVR